MSGAGFQRSLDFEAALPFGDEAIVCESVAEVATAAPATMGAWIDRAHRGAERKREKASEIVHARAFLGLTGACGATTGMVTGDPDRVTCSRCKA